MFAHTLTKGWPWEQGIEPDAKNDTAEVYIEKRYTRYLQWDKKLEMIIPSLATSYVALVRFTDGKMAWVIMDNVGVFYETSRLEDLFAHMDMLHLAGGIL
jgi:hypothetical protein